MVEGIENLPLEATSPNSHSSQSNVPDLFAKVVELTDRIKITLADSQGNPEKNKPDNNKKDNKNTPIPNSVKEYFRKNNVKSIKLEKHE